MFNFMSKIARSNTKLSQCILTYTRERERVCLQNGGFTWQKKNTNIKLGKNRKREGDEMILFIQLVLIN
uniref:Uncharacterized protein n=1 Tax=Arundo donax TaxID=35708 RepID=A0A0A9DP47_ARUDO